jgi:hypothetical protein
MDERSTLLDGEATVAKGDLSDQCPQRVLAGLTYPHGEDLLAHRVGK